LHVKRSRMHLPQRILPYMDCIGLHCRIGHGV